MPCPRVTVGQAALLFGLSSLTSAWVLRRLVAEEFLWRTAQGEFMRRVQTP